jgi:integrase
LKKVLTELAIKNLKPGHERKEVSDGKVGGLYLVIQPSGRKSWALRYRSPGDAGKHVKLTLGSYPGVTLAGARGRASEALGRIAQGVDPAATRLAAREAGKATDHPPGDLIEKVTADFIERHAKPNTRGWGEVERLLEKDVVSRWNGRRLSEIRKADVHELLDAMCDRGAPVGANRVFSHFRKMCSWAVERGLIERSPCEGLSAPSSEKTRDRVLSDEELRLVWVAAGELGFPFGPIVRLLVLTGQRRAEIAESSWSEIDLKKKLWVIPASRTKNGRAHDVPLSPAAIEILAALPRFARSGGEQDFVFSGRTTPPSGYSRAKTRLDRATGQPMPPWVIHDIRRSVASGMAGIGVSLPVIERCLNHVSGSFGGIVGVYQRHCYADETRAALDAWARALDAIVTGAPAGNVIDLAARK